MNNPILEEVWKAKDEVARECNYDLNKLFNHLRQQQGKDGHKVVDLSKKAIKKPAV